MNRNRYRLVFNTTLGIQVPVAETARSRGKGASGSTRVCSGVLVASLILASPAWADPASNALPAGGIVTHGDIGIVQSGNTLNINQASQAGIIHWNSFNVGSGGTVNFNQPNVTSATLNRIVGNEASIIQGAMNATGAVYVINRNGIVFDKGAQVNLHTLVASTLDIKDDATFLQGYLGLGGKSAAFSSGYNSTGALNMSGLPGNVEVKAGAYMLSQAGGRIVLMAPQVENSGDVETRGGQIIVAAGEKAYFRTPETEDSLLRGLVVTVESGGTAKNLGKLEAGAGGDVSLIGAIVKQQGVASASTTVNVNGTIHLLAQHINPAKALIKDSQDRPAANETGDVVIGENSRTAIMPALDPGKVKAALESGKLTQAQIDAYTRGETTLAQFFAYVADDTLQDAQTFVPSRMIAQGKTVWVQKGATMVTPGGNINLFGRGDLVASASLLKDSAAAYLTDPASVCLDCRVQVDAGARLDVSGLRDVAVAMERNVVEVELRGNELRDSPLLHGETNPFYEAMYGDASNPLYAQKIKVDIRDVTTVDINGKSVERRGTALADASGYIAQIGRTVDEKSTTGGTINLNSEGGVVVQQGATLDVSGGSVQYQDGDVTTSQLLYKGTAYDIATATPDKLYSGLGANKTVREKGYNEGKDAGSVSIVAPVAALQGTVAGRTVAGIHQRGDTPSGALPQGGQLVLGFNNTKGTAYQDYRLMNPVSFGAVNSDAPDFGTPLWTSGAPVLNPAMRKLVLDSTALKQNGISRLAVYTNNGIVLASNQTLDMGVKGTVDLTAAQIDVAGNILTPGGHVNLTTENTAYDDARAQLGMEARALDGHLTVSGAIVTAGRWANDLLDTRLHNPLVPLAIDGGDIKVGARNGALRLERGSLLDASAGAWLKVDGATTVGGNAGGISIKQYAPLNGNLDQTKKLVLGGTLQSYGVMDSAGKAGRGGTLDLQTYGEMQVGGRDPLLSTVMWVAEPFFSAGGFSAYALNSLGGDLNVADGARIAPRTQTRLLSSGQFKRVFGTGLAGFSQRVTLSRDTVAKSERPAANLSLSAKADPASPAGAPVGGNLRVGKGAAIELDSLADLSLTADNVLSVNGRLATPGGQIQLRAGKADVAYVPNSSIWLGEDASLSVKGRARTYRDGGLITGDVLDGGNIALLTHGYIVAKAGALLDASGAVATLDRRNPVSGRWEKTALPSAGGGIRLAASEGLFLDAGATLKATGGNADAERGTLSVELARFAPTGDAALTYPAAPRQMALYANQANANPTLTQPGSPLAMAGNGKAVLSVSHLANFDHANLKSADSIVFADSLQVDVRGRLAVDAPLIEVAAAANPTTVELKAMAVNLGNGDPLYQLPVPEASAGNGELTVDAGLIDLTGRFALSGVAQTTLNSTGDIRVIGALTQDELVDRKVLAPKGQLTTAGDLRLKAAQVYATTLSDFTLVSTKTDGLIDFSGGRNRDNTLYVPPLPLSGAGRIQVKADAIKQDGVLRAPLGQIVLDATRTLTLTDGSLTSVSGEGQAIPFGRVQNGRDWVYDLYGVARTVYSGDEDIVNVVAKDIQLKAAAVDVKAGATVDMSGGGDLVGYEFAAGAGGSENYLAAPGVFAIMPAGNPAFAPADFQANEYAYHSVANDLKSTGASQSVKPGDSVFLSAIPELGIKAGYYTLLPGQYALLPGAVAVRAVPGTQDMQQSQNTRRQDGSYVVAGYPSTLANASTGAKRWSGFEIAGRDVVATNSTYSFNVPAGQLKSQTLTGRSEIADYRISQLIPAVNQTFGAALPRFGQDAGRLSVTANTELKLDGHFDFSKADGALGGELDIAAAKIAVTDGTPTLTIPSDFLVLDADRLAAFKVDSLMIGGMREAIAGEPGSLKVNQVANAVQVDATLKGPEVMLVSGGRIDLADGSAVIGSGAGGVSSETLVYGDVVTPGDGVLVRASSGDARSVVRNNISGGGLATDGLFAASTSTVSGEKSVNLDTTHTEFNLGKVELGNNGTLNLGASRINLGQTQAATQGLFVTHSLLAALGAPKAVVLKSYSNFDVYGLATLGGAHTERLVFEGAGFVRKAGTVAGDFNVAAQSVRFSNPDAAVLDTAGASGSATLNVKADTIELAQGPMGTAGFGEVNLQATGEIAGVGGGIGGFAASDKLNLRAQRITAYNGSDTRISAGGALVTAQAGAAPGIALPMLADAPLGGKLALTGDSIEHGGNIELPVGWLTMTAETGDLKVKDGSAIFAGGVVRNFIGANDTVKVYVAGGGATLDARQGDLTVEQGARVDVSGTGGADAGTLDIRVPRGTFTLQADLTGGAEEKTATVANPDTGTPWQGAFSLDAQVLSDADSATANDFSSLLAHVNGFGDGFAFRQRRGDLKLGASNTIKARRVVLSADDGVVDLAGLIDSHADAGGWVVAAAGKELYLRNGATIDAHATGVGQRGGEVYLISGMNQANVAAGASNGALVLENGSTIAVDGTLPSEVRYAGNTPGDPDIVLNQISGGRVHLQAPRLASGQDVRITHKALTDSTLFDSSDAIGTQITGAASVEAIGNKIDSHDTPSYTLGTAQMNVIKAETQTYMSTAAAANARLNPGLGGAFHLRPGVEIRNTGDMVFGDDYDLGILTAVSGGQPGTLALRAGGNLLVNGNLSDGFDSATGTTLDSGESWAYRLAAGADLGAADSLAVQHNLPQGVGDFVLQGGRLIRTGTGAIQIAAAGDIEIGLNSDGTSYDSASVIYTAGRLDSNPDVALKARSDTRNFKAVNPVDGGALSIMAGGAIRAPKPAQLMNNWLVRRGQEDATGKVRVSLVWGIDFAQFNQGVGALGGGAVRVAADGDIENLAVSLPTVGRDYATEAAGSKLLQTGGANLDVQAGGDIRSAVFYVQRGAGRIVSGGEIGAENDGLNLLLALGEANIDATARTGLKLESAFNPTVAPMGTAVSSALSIGNTNRASSFFTYGPSSGVNLVAVQGDLILRNDLDNQIKTILPGLSHENDAIAYLAYPGSLTAAALQGDVRIEKPFTLYPAAKGQLHLLASDNVDMVQGAIYMSDKDLSQVSSQIHPTQFYQGPGRDNSTLPLALVPVHGEDTDPVRIYAENGSVKGVPVTAGNLGFPLVFPKPIEVLAGQDIVDLSVVAQNLTADQTSQFRAGRDIRYSASRNENGDLIENGRGIRIGGPGYLEVVAGRHLDLGTTGGIVTTGNLDNPALPYGGADIALWVGMGTERDAQGHPRPRLPDTDAFLAKKGELAVVDYYAGLMDYERLRQALLDPDNAGLQYKDVLNKLEDPAYRSRMASLAQSEYNKAKTAFDSLLGSPVISDRARAARLLYFNELQQASAESSVMKQLAGLGVDLNTLNSADQPGVIEGLTARIAEAQLPTSSLERFARLFERAKLLIAHNQQQPDYDSTAHYDVLAELGYAGRADTAIATYLPENDYAGNLGGFYSQVRTEQGSDMDLLTPGGNVTAGLVNAEKVLGKRDADIGLYTINGGAIRSYSDGDFLVNSSRVFTLGWEATQARNDHQRLSRDDVFLYSRNGDVDGGNGAKTTSSTPPPTFTTDAQGFVKSDIGAAISGSGIGVLLARKVINRGATYLIAPNGTVNAGDAGVRASGDLFIDASRVSGLNNIVAVGLSVGVPAAVDTSGLGVSPVASLGDAAKAASDATSSLANASADAQQAAEDVKQSLASFKPNLITVEVLGFGDEPGNCAPDDAACRKKKAGGG